MSRPKWLQQMADARAIIGEHSVDGTVLEAADTVTAAIVDAVDIVIGLADAYHREALIFYEERDVEEMTAAALLLLTDFAQQARQWVARNGGESK